MTCSQKIVLACLAAVAVAAKASAETHVIDVSPDGTTPFAALERIRAARRSGDRGAWTVRVAKGGYRFDRTLTFRPEDSGTPERPVRWIGETGAVFAGGETVAGWRARADGLWEAPCRYVESLYWRGKRLERAKLPAEGGFLVPEDATECECRGPDGEKLYRMKFAVDDGRVDVLGDLAPDELATVKVRLVMKWSYSEFPLDAFVASNRQVEVVGTEPSRGWKLPKKAEGLVEFANVRAGLGAEGTWYYDAREGTILYRPRAGERLADFRPLAPTSDLDALVRFEGDYGKGDFVHDIEFRGISFKASSFQGERLPNGASRQYMGQAASRCGGAISADGAHRISFVGCEIRETGNYAVWFERGCVSNRFVGCTMTELGAGGLWFGSRKRNITHDKALPLLEPYSQMVDVIQCPYAYAGDDRTAFNVVSNCDISVCGRVNREGCGVVFTHASDNVLVNCDIHDLYYTGVSLGWTWGYRGSVAQRNTVAFNRIWDIGKGVMSDMAGVYTLGASFGTAITNNVIHTVRSYRYGGHGIYNDEGSEGVLWENNLVYDTSSGSFHQHYGRDNVLRNNILANGKEGGILISAAEPHRSFTLERNIVWWDNDPEYPGYKPPTRYFNCSTVDIDWRTNFFFCANGPTEVGLRRLKPKMHRVAVGYNLPEDRRENPPMARHMPPPVVVCDPLFVDPANGDFRLNPGSPVLKYGFRPWDFEASGRRPDEPPVPSVF